MTDNIDRLLPMKEVRQITGLSKSTIYRKIAAQTFPRPAAVSEACVRWRESSIVAWMSSLPDTSRAA